jgi:hypothetical protein
LAKHNSAETELKNENHTVGSKKTQLKLVEKNFRTKKKQKSNFRTKKNENIKKKNENHISEHD